MLHERDAGVGRHAAPLPCARHVTAKRCQHGRVAHDHYVVTGRRARHPVEHLARPGSHLDQALASRRAPLPVDTRVVVGVRPDGPVGLSRQFAIAPLTQPRLDHDREAENTRQDVRRLPRSGEGAGHDPDRRIALRDPFPGGTCLAAALLGERHVGCPAEDAVAVALALAVSDEEESSHSESGTDSSRRCSGGRSAAAAGRSSSD